MASIKFKGPGVTKHGRLILAPSVPTSFEDEHAEDYFVEMGWAEDSNEDPVVTYPEGSVEIDPLTVFADGPKKGQYVLSTLAEAKLAELAKGSEPVESSEPAPAGEEA